MSKFLHQTSAYNFITKKVFSSHESFLRYEEQIKIQTEHQKSIYIVGTTRVT